MIRNIFHIIAELGGFTYAVVQVTKCLLYFLGGPSGPSPFSRRELDEFEK